MGDYEGYSPRNRAERVISVGRLFLAAFLLVGVTLDSTEPGLYARLVRQLAVSYLTYSAALALLTWKGRATARALPFLTQAVDLFVFSVFMHFSEGPASPFFVYFVFATICGAVRWHGRGALLTGAAALAAYILVTIVGVSRFGAREFETVRFVTRCAHLAVVAGLLAYLGAYLHRLQREVESLAAWPRRLPVREADAVNELLTYAARVLAVPRLVLAWEEEDEPSLRIASLSGDRYEVTREKPDVSGRLVARELRHSSFLTLDAGSASADVLQRVPGGFQVWAGDALDTAFRDRFHMKSVVALRLSADTIEGWLFALDLKRPSADDLLLGDIVGRLVTGALELHALVEQLRETAAAEERLRLARELHDGVLQTLTAAALQAQSARKAVAVDTSEADRRLATIEQTILSEQRALRLAIADLTPGTTETLVVQDCAERVREAAARVARLWEVDVRLDLQRDIPPVPYRTAHEIVRMVQESLVNAVRHGVAREIRLSFSSRNGEARLAVAYEGRGFPGLNGRHDLQSLNALKAGPRTLKERVSALGGSLEIDSADHRARVEIGVPIRPAG